MTKDSRDFSVSRVRIRGTSWTLIAEHTVINVRISTSLHNQHQAHGMPTHTSDKNRSDVPNAELDLGLEYSPSRWCRRLGPAESIREYIRICNEESNRFLRGSGFKAILDEPYGESSAEKVDIFIPQEAKKDAPVFMFIHGGYWQAKEVTKENHSFLAAPILSKGAIVIIVGYGLAPKYTIPEIKQQIKQATKLVANKFPDTRGIYISGHSAGGHLCAMMLSVDWSSCLGVQKNVIKGICPVSGVFDLQPLVSTYVNDPLSLTESSAVEVSPMFLVDSIPKCNVGIKVRLTYAEYDPPAFHKQSQDYCRLLSALGFNASCCELQGREHFDEVTELLDENSPLLHVFRELIAG